MLLSALLVHYFIPHEKNNHRAKLLQPLFVSIFALVFLSLQFLTLFVPNLTPVVLGYSSNIKPEEVIRLTNVEREKAGLADVKSDEELNKAALAKASDMFARNYWAHNAPDGTEPWYFFVQAGYRYRWAGENLARDFSNSEGVVQAWINSPAHKENLLSPNYEDIGVAVVDGKLNGVQTTLVVQLFGTKIGSPTFKEASAASEGAVTVSQAEPPQSQILSVAGVSKEKLLNLISPFKIVKTMALSIVSIFILLIILDIIIVKHKNIARVSSRGFVHLSFLLVILAAIVFAKSGFVL